RWLLAALLLAVSATTSAATTFTLSPGQSITAAVEAASDGDTIQLNPGVYNPVNTGAYTLTGSFGIGKSVTIRGLGATPAQTILRGGAAPVGEFAFYFLRYSSPPTATSPSGATLENLTIDTSPGGI